MDDHPVVRQGLRLLLEQEGILVCGEAEDPGQALDHILASSPDLVMVDLSLGGESGLPLLRRITDLMPGVHLLVYSMHEDSFHISQALASGASGYVTKREVSTVLTTAICQILEGNRYLSPRVAGVLTDMPSSTVHPEPLSPQELKIYRLLGRGYTPAGIASELGVSRRTVDSYFGRILLKLDLSGMEELRRHAAERLPEP